ncbi:AraC family transcriptional regulator [Sinomicrobium pectinilyticum]|uniref:AraC family transcriptional regulator n=1 Tax=Sinomicrobium pectinilyticum TaxID=1084421 RepID=A0A3N0ESJ1_SINP1|nr:helix-turn-helix domain-containing protein [Sinomicrobium pectinilyticum]RNL90744.1 AraC family transcriptional regulator [Sinomicrobium pectinilyticum]
MHDLPDIRKHFKPLQPTVGGNDSGVTYSELFPHMHLGNYIYCYWELKTTRRLTTPFPYKVVADACTDIFFETGNPEDMFVMGFSTEYTEFPLDPQFRYIGIRFLPAAFPLLFRIGGNELTGRVEALHHLLPHVFNGLIPRVSGNMTFPEYAGTFDCYFREVVGLANLNTDHRFFNALDIIIKKQGILQVQEELDTGVSPRQLRRLFDFYIGSTPKTFSKVVRFQHILQAKPSTQSLRENKVFFDAGYYDQSHFIKEFKNMYGMTPSLAWKIRT